MQVYIKLICYNKLLILNNVNITQFYSTTFLMSQYSTNMKLYALNSDVIKQFHNTVRFVKWLDNVYPGFPEWNSFRLPVLQKKNLMQIQNYKFLPLLEIDPGFPGYKPVAFPLPHKRCGNFKWCQFY